MGVPGSVNNLLGAGGAPQYLVERSLRFNASDSAYLSRTPASAGNRKTWTWAAWVKISDVAQSGCLFSSFIASANHTSLTFLNGNFQILNRIAAVNQISLLSTGLYRDPSAWYHLVLSVDAANTALTLYINGVADPGINSVTIPSTDTFVNSTDPHSIGSRATTTFFNGYLADIYFIDGQALTPSSFAETNATTGQWVPKAYTGSFGTNGFRLDFSDNSAATATTLGKDRAGSNNWTPNNLSVTAGAGNDSLVDTPTSYGTDTGAGGEVRGNYCTWNPLAKGASFSLTNGNLEGSSTSLWQCCRSTFQIPSTGKWYAEFTYNGNGRNGNDRYAWTGVCTENASFTEDGAGANCLSWSDGYQAFNFSGADIDTSSINKLNGGVVSLQIDRDANTFAFFYNGSAGPSGTIGVAAGTPLYFAMGHYPGYTTSIHANFGQRPFAYTAPSGFKALCDTNLPAPVVAKPSTVMDVKLYTGNGSTQTISGLGFSPDFVWLKSRGNTYFHHLYDQLRGAQKAIYSNDTSAEVTETTGLTAFGTDGFTVSSDAEVNGGSGSYVAWAWDAGSSNATNTSGSITSTVRANASAGFSIVTVGSIPANDVTIGHGLNTAPEFIFGKNRDAANSWMTYHKNLTPDYCLFLNSTNGQTLDYSYSQGVGAVPTSTTFPIRRNNWGASGGQNLVFYCFAPVTNYSAFGSYTGNGAQPDGPFIYTGFRPAFLMIKSSSAALDGWFIVDNRRPNSNLVNKYLYANSSAIEATANICDFCANGFKIRYNYAGINQNGATYIYAAFAENPFQFARAR